MTIAEFIEVLSDLDIEQRFHFVNRGLSMAGFVKDLSWSEDNSVILSLEEDRQWGTISSDIETYSIGDVVMFLQTADDLDQPLCFDYNGDGVVGEVDLQFWDDKLRLFYLDDV